MRQDLSKDEQAVINELGEGLIGRPIGRMARVVRRLQSKGLVKYLNGYVLTHRGKEIYTWLKGIEHANAI